MSSKIVVAIDPGTTESAVVVWSGAKILQAEILKSGSVFRVLQVNQYPVFCEMVACYGMAVGKEVFETCLWIGEYRHFCATNLREFTPVYRRDVKLHHCGSARANDGNVIQALKDKYGDKGTKKAPGITYGLKSHLWQAFAIATMVTEQETIKPCEEAK